MKQIIVAITGASGAAYAQRLVQGLVEGAVHVHVVASPMGRRVLVEELGLRELTPAGLVGRPVTNWTLYPYRDLGARIASGSFLTDGMVICPCSSNTLAAVASGLADNLISRAAQVTLKEARRLILVPRETPLAQIEIANMLRVSQAGGILCPAAPGFYLRPKTIAELVDFVVARVLDLLGVPHALGARWDPERPAAPAPAPRADAG